MNNTVFAIDLGKNNFHLVAVCSNGKVGQKKMLSRSQFARYFVNREPCEIAMEACGSAHFWARLFISQGHAVQLLPPQHVKPWRQGQKNDFNDAIAIGSAALSNRVRPVAVKSQEQLDQQSLHRQRSLVIKNRTALINQIRGLLAERGVVMSTGVSAMRKALPLVIENKEGLLTPMFLQLINRLYHSLITLDEEHQWYTEQVHQQARTDELVKRLTEIPGVGPIVACALRDWLGDASQYSSGRSASAAIGVVPRQFSTGGKQKLGGITKRGDSYLRTLLIHGARAALIQCHRRDDQLSRWAQGLKERRGNNRATVALANKIMRIAWVLVRTGESYRSRPYSETA